LPDIIQLLPDNIANQIAAGEVIQRPASAVKELLENAVDAGATDVRLIIQDAGKALVQVIDNGKGMSDTDARMAFERHATSKISHIDDLFRIRTMGFRGEALASIAAVAQVTIKTRRAEDETGTYLEIENSTVKKQEPVATPVGTNVAMKNVFFNVPARRNFLKSNASETRHIVDEFIRVAMAFPGIFFSLTTNGQEVFHLERGTLKQRIVQVLGSNYNARLVSVQEQTDYLNIYGFVGKPDTAKKTRGDQYFFVNNRFIRSAYLHHAVMNAYQEIIAADSFPAYVLYIDLDPAQIDINVHPTKQEIKFEDERIVYAFVQAAVKHALAQFSVTPTLEFDLDPNIQQLDAVTKPFTEDKQAAASASNLFKDFTQKHQAHFIQPSNKSELKHWKDFYEPGSKQEEAPRFESLLDKIKAGDPADSTSQQASLPGQPLQWLSDAPLTQLQHTYIVASTNRGFILVQQQLAHERVLYDRFSEALKGKPVVTQRSLFPVTLQLATQDAVLLHDLLEDLQLLGFEVEPFGKDTFVIQGTPADLVQGHEKRTIESLLEQFKHFNNDMRFSKREKMLRAMAYQRSVKPGRSLSKEEMYDLLNELFASLQPNTTAGGNPTYIEFKWEYLAGLFNR
jgi:DNA mismatch repair protein MutL